MERIRDALEARGVVTINPVGGAGHGHLDLKVPRGTRIRLDSDGHVSLFNQHEGTHNQRLLIPVTSVDLRSRNWLTTAVDALVFAIQPLMQSNRQPKAPRNDDLLDIVSDKRKGKPPRPALDVTAIRTIIEMWSNGASEHEIAHAVMPQDKNGLTRTHRVLVGEMWSNNRFERLYRSSGGIDVDELRKRALEVRTSSGIPDDRAVVALRSRLAANR
jgi:hypothetical protein